jgi:hypothetical protein
VSASHRGRFGLIPLGRPDSHNPHPRPSLSQGGAFYGEAGAGLRKISSIKSFLIAVVTACARS